VALAVHLTTPAHVLLQNWNDAPLVFFLPKSTDTTITELCIENMVRPSVFATAVVPLEDMKKYTGGKGGSGALSNMLHGPVTCYVCHVAVSGWLRCVDHWACRRPHRLPPQNHMSSTTNSCMQHFSDVSLCPLFAASFVTKPLLCLQRRRQLAATRKTLQAQTPTQPTHVYCIQLTSLCVPCCLFLNTSVIPAAPQAAGSDAEDTAGTHTTI
jgi:hypothetical protein